MTRRAMLRIAAIGAGALVLAMAVIGFRELQQPPVNATGIDPGNPQQVARGRVVYAQRCAACHGANLEGQPNWRIRMRNGRLPAPPHDETGHTWHHPDAVLIGIVKHGLLPPYAPPDYPSDMPAFGSILSDADIRAALSYIESRWPPDVMKIRRQMIEQQAGARG